MRKYTLFLALTSFLFGYSQQDTVTFQVDMNNYYGATFTNVHVNGTFNSWCGSCNPLSDANNDGIWEGAIPLTADTIEFKFTLDGWTGQETLDPALSCTTPATTNTNRYLIFTSDTVLPVVCWESCSPCGPFKSQPDLPITWDDTTVNRVWTDFGDNSSSLTADPSNASNTVLMSTKPATAPGWAGTTLHDQYGLANAIPFYAGGTMASVRVYSPDSAMPVLLKAETNGDPTKSVETLAHTTVANGWQTLYFDFANERTGTAAINYTYVYDKLSIFYNFDITGATAGALDFYCDDIMYVDSTTPPPTPDTVTFRVDMRNYSATTYTGVYVNGTYNQWCGSCNPMSDANNDSIWEVTLPIPSGVIEYKFTLDGWAGQETLDPLLSCTTPVTVNTNRILDIQGNIDLPAVCWESCDTCALTSPPPSTGGLTLPITFDDTSQTYGFTDFGNNHSMFTADPTNASNNVLMSVKSDTAATWAGTTVHDTLGLASPIPFDSSGTMMSVRVYAPAAGMDVLLKTEDIDDPTKSVETLAQTSVANGWETLYFDFSNERTGTAPINYTYEYDKLSIFYNFDVSGAAAGELEFYCDDIDFVDSTSAPVIPTVDTITFRVDMSDYSATSYTGVYVNGTFNSWCGSCNPMTDANNDSIWEVSLPIPSGNIEYKFTLDGWTGQESLDPALPCTTPATVNTNRFLSIAGDTILPVVCWEACIECDLITPPGIANITFQVDMNQYTDPFTTPEVNGTFNNWCGNCAPMSDANMDGIWDITIPLNIGDTIDFKYSHDNWLAQESLTPGSPCTQTSSGFTNRFLAITGDTTLPAVCWESCVACGGTPLTAEVTFMVDLSEYTGSYSEVHLNGTFNNWCGTCAPMTDANNDSIYELTVTVPTDTIEYKFTLDGWTTEESLTDGDTCTKTTTDAGGTFVNRVLIPTGDTTLIPVCWESCNMCGDIGIDESFVREFTIAPNPSDGAFEITGSLMESEDYTITILDAVGRVVYENGKFGLEIKERIDLRSLGNGLYHVLLKTDSGMVSERILLF